MPANLGAIDIDTISCRKKRGPDSQDPRTPSALTGVYIAKIIFAPGNISQA
jgi:hypothetical protein